MAGKIEERLRAQRARYFVGRDVELQQLEAALDSDAPVAFVYGAAGVGKTTLLRQFSSQCQDRGLETLVLDARELEPNPAGFQRQFASMVKADGRLILHIDNYETLEPLDRWIRDAFIPDLPENTFVLLASRKGPSVGWLSDPAWKDMITEIPLGNLNLSECKRYLDKREIPAGNHDSLLKFTRGHPLALSLLADVVKETGEEFKPEESVDVIGALVERFIEAVPNESCRAALEVCALARVTTEPLLRAAVRNADAAELFAWLRSLSFVETGAYGLHPHDLARDAIALDLKWRNPDRFATIHKLVRAYYGDQLSRATGIAQQALLFDYIFLHRESPAVSAFFQFDAAIQGYADALHAEDIPALVKMTKEHEGDESAKWVQHYAETAPDAFLVIRSADQLASSPTGFVIQLDVARQGTSDDPAVKAARSFLAANASFGDERRATLFRNWMSRDGYQAISPVQSLLFVHIVRHYLTTPGLAFTLLPCADPQMWAPVFAYAGTPRLQEADFETGGNRYGIYGHDFRTTTPAEWLQVLAEREVPFAVAAQPSGANRCGFDAAVVDALKSGFLPHRLKNNVLLEARMVAKAGGEGDTPEQRIRVLQTLFREGALSLRGTPADLKAFKALKACYFEPFATQEIAADKLGLGIATLRRHLREGEKGISDWLWAKEAASQ